MAATGTRTQAARRAATTAALLAAARESFAQDGYAATSLDAVVAAAGVSKGALYHHYAGKRELFGAVYEREQEKLAEVCAAAALEHADDPWAAVEAGARAFLDGVLDPEVQRIVLIDSFAALGHEDVRAGEATAMALLQQGLAQAMEAGRIASRPVEPLAALLFGAICEGALTVARADDQAAAHSATLAEVGRLFAAYSSS